MKIETIDVGTIVEIAVDAYIEVLGNACIVSIDDETVNISDLEQVEQFRARLIRKIDSYIPKDRLQ